MLTYTAGMILGHFEKGPEGLVDLGVSKNRGTPKWMVYDGKPYENGWFEGIPLFLETPICWMKSYRSLFTLQSGVWRSPTRILSKKMILPSKKAICGGCDVCYLLFLRYRDFGKPSALRTWWPANFRPSPTKMKVTTDYCRDLQVQLYVNEYRHLFDKGGYWGNHDGYWCVFKPCARFFLGNLITTRDDEYEAWRRQGWRRLIIWWQRGWMFNIKSMRIFHYIDELL